MLHGSCLPRASAATCAARSLLLALLLAALAALTACGGGGGGGSSVNGAADSIALAFPPPHSLTDQISFDLFGTTSRPRRIARVEANGIPGTTRDHFSHWNVAVALGAPTTVFSIDALDGASHVLSRQATSIEFAPVPRGAHDLAYDPLRDQLLTSESRGDSGLTGLDFATGRPFFVSGPQRGGGDAFRDEVDAVEVDAANDRAFVIVDTSDEIVAVRLRDGLRTVVSDFSSGGPRFGFPRDLALDAGRNRLVVADLSLDAIVAVDVATGARSILSDATHGSGTALDRPERIAVVAGLDVALVITRGSDDLVGVNLANGDRSVVSGASRGSGPALVSPHSVAFDARHGQAVVANGFGTILVVDLANGDRTLVASDTLGTGPSLAGLVDLVVLPSKFLAVSVAGQKTILLLDPATGNRTDAETMRVGAGPRFANLVEIAADATAEEYFVLEFDLNSFSLASVDPRTGDRTEISTATRGAGPALQSPQNFTVVDRRRRAFVADGTLRALVAIDLDTGDRTIVSDATTGSGVVFEHPDTVVVDDARNRAFVTDDSFTGYRLIGVDLATGDRSEFSGPNRGSGPFPNLVRSAAVERSGESVLLLDLGDDAVMRIDLVTGDRSIASGQGVGAGQDFLGIVPSIVLAGDAQHAFVSDRILGVVEVDLATGDRTVAAAADRALGPAFGAISPFSRFGEQRLFAIHEGGGAVVEIDRASGKRVVISR